MRRYSANFSLVAGCVEVRGLVSLQQVGEGGMVGGVEVKVLSAAGGGRGHGWWVEVRGLFSLQQVGEGGHGWWG